MQNKQCKCPPGSPFHWQEDTSPSIFFKDPTFRTKNLGGLPADKSVLDYRQFGIYSKAVPVTKRPNKHERGLG